MRNHYENYNFSDGNLLLKKQKVKCDVFITNKDLNIGGKSYKLSFNVEDSILSLLDKDNTTVSMVKLPTALHDLVSADFYEEDESLDLKFLGTNKEEITYSIDLSQVFDYIRYTNGDGIEIADNVISIKLNDDEKVLSFKDGALTADLTDIYEAIDERVDERVDEVLDEKVGELIDEKVSGLTEDIEEIQCQLCTINNGLETLTDDVAELEGEIEVITTTLNTLDRVYAKIDYVNELVEDKIAETTSAFTTFDDVEEMIENSVKDFTTIESVEEMISTAIEESAVTSGSFNDVACEVVDGELKIEVDTNDINMGDYSEVEYNETFKEENPEVQNVISGDTISEAINKVETALSALVDETIDNEASVVKSFESVVEACGILDEETDLIKYVPDTTNEIISGATSLYDADELLSEAVADKVNASEVNEMIEEATSAFTTSEEVSEIVSEATKDFVVMSDVDEAISAATEGLIKDVEELKEYFAIKNEKWNGIEVTNETALYYFYSVSNDYFLTENKDTRNIATIEPTLWEVFVNENIITLKSTVSGNFLYISKPSIGTPQLNFDTSVKDNTIERSLNEDYNGKHCQGKVYDIYGTSSNGSNRRYIATNRDGSVGSHESFDTFSYWMFITPEQYNKKKVIY